VQLDLLFVNARVGVIQVWFEMAIEVSLILANEPHVQFLQSGQYRAAFEVGRNASDNWRILTGQSLPYALYSKCIVLDLPIILSNLLSEQKNESALSLSEKAPAP
jgi:hypothetical protein